ncbi:MAG: hypothetical protein WCV00_21670 [Verrucomicrobiia bacterium]
MRTHTSKVILILVVLFLAWLCLREQKVRTPPDWPTSYERYVSMVSGFGLAKVVETNTGVTLFQYNPDDNSAYPIRFETGSNGTWIVTFKTKRR